MAVSAISSASTYQPASEQISPTSGHHHRRGGVHTPSFSDLDAQSSSVSSGLSPSRVGSKVDITV